ncbi:glucan synthase-like 12 [Perilla frutescens var. hirtella]|uniref:Glucan synthase-like 12 n=1 Tax=Perilla frutescens var. hirtella TaxID=608512 RepID=A0AAD4PAY6_PERFH|nr:glucan synthase-like 12 [Perilla frutescens var. hirtella]
MQLKVELYFQKKTEGNEAVLVLDKVNQELRSYVMRNFLMGKKIWGYVCGMKSKPIEADNEKYEEQMEVWQVNNSKIITWINNSVDNSIAMTESAELRVFPPYIARCEEQRLVQFFMALRDDFEALRGNILHCSPKPNVDAIVSELIAEELRLKALESSMSLTGQQRHFFKFSTSSFRFPAMTSRPSNTAVVASSSSATSAEVLLEHLQKLLNQQPHAMSAAAGFPTSSSTGISPSEWILDSEAFHHMSPTADSFVSRIPSNSVQDLHSKRRIGTSHSFHLSPSSSDFYLWHSRIGHVSSSRLNYLVSTRRVRMEDEIDGDDDTEIEWVEVLKAVNLTEAVEVDDEILEKTQIYVPYNILPLDPESSHQAIMIYLEIKAYVAALRNTRGFPWPKGPNEKVDEDILDWL